MENLITDKTTALKAVKENPYYLEFCSKKH